MNLYYWLAMRMRLRLGVSLAFTHPDPTRNLFQGKTLQYLEEGLILAVDRSGAVPVPLVDLKSEAGAYRVLEGLDGLVFSGGADVSPLNYGEEPLDPAWSGDPVRDAYEMRLIQAARRLGLPMLGICRGAQVLNVGLGGTLYQDIRTFFPDSLVHRCQERYDQLEHTVHLTEGSWLHSLYAEPQILVNTVHHQAVKNLAPGLTATAHAPDGVIESYERITPQEWIVGIQWHPEWLELSETARSDGNRVFRSFAQVCAARQTCRMAS